VAGRVSDEDGLIAALSQVPAVGIGDRPAFAADRAGENRYAVIAGSSSGPRLGFLTWSGSP